MLHALTLSLARQLQVHMAIMWQEAPPVSLRTAETTDAPHRPPPASLWHISHMPLSMQISLLLWGRNSPPPASLWHFSHMPLSMQILLLLWGRYSQHQDHNNQSSGEDSPAKELVDAQLFPALEWDLSSRLILLSNDVPPPPTSEVARQLPP